MDAMHPAGRRHLVRLTGPAPLSRLQHLFKSITISLYRENKLLRHSLAHPMLQPGLRCRSASGQGARQRRPASCLRRPHRGDERREGFRVRQRPTGRNQPGDRTVFTANWHRRCDQSDDRRAVSWYSRRVCEPEHGRSHAENSLRRSPDHVLAHVPQKRRTTVFFKRLTKSN